MINCSCLVQEGQAADLRKLEIQDCIKRFVTDSFGQDSRITWATVDTGNGFTAGKPSTSSVVSIASDQPLSQERREYLLRKFVSLWTSKTDSTTHEIVAVITDPQVS